MLGGFLQLDIFLAAFELAPGQLVQGASLWVLRIEAVLIYAIDGVPRPSGVGLHHRQDRKVRWRIQGDEDAGVLLFGGPSGGRFAVDKRCIVLVIRDGNRRGRLETHRRGIRNVRAAVDGLADRVGCFHIAEQGHDPGGERGHCYDEDGGEDADDDDAGTGITAAAEARLLGWIIFLSWFFFRLYRQGLGCFFWFIRCEVAQALGDAGQG